MSVTFLGFLYLIYNKNFYVLIVNLAVLTIIQIVLLIRYLNITNRELSRFFSSLESKDSGLIYQNELDNSPGLELQKSLNRLNSIIRESRKENTKQYNYLKNVIDHVSTGILSFDSKGNIELYNIAAAKLFCIPSIRNISKLDELLPGFSKLLKQLRPNIQKLVNIKVNTETIPISVKNSIFKIEDREIRLVSFQNIKQELEEKEVDSWQKLIRVLTHEIMNSISPISSITTTISRLFKNKNTNKVSLPVDINKEVIAKTVKGMKIIDERGKGLISFVDKFRSLTLFPEPVKQKINIEVLIQDIEMLLEEELRSNKVVLNTEMKPDNIILYADKKQVEQVLINLINNSIYALRDAINKKIILRAFYEVDNRVCIKIIDNGKGIPEDILDQIFIPFFTTREKSEDSGHSGSGIGLSLSRQIMRLHDGIISVRSKPGETVFSLRF